MLPSLMTAAFSAADQRRRQTDPLATATRPSSRFASSLPSNITIARSSPLPQATQTPRSLPLKKGVGTPLTAHRRGQPQFAERAVETGEVQILIDQPPAMQVDHLVDAIGELESAVLDIHRGFGARQV